MPNTYSKELAELFAENPQAALAEADRVLTNYEIYIDLLRDAVVEGNREILLLEKAPSFWGWNVRFERNWRDLWIGVFWKHDRFGRFDLWLILLPCFPLHIRNYRESWS